MGIIAQGLTNKEEARLLQGVKPTYIAFGGTVNGKVTNVQNKTLENPATVSYITNIGEEKVFICPQKFNGVITKAEFVHGELNISIKNDHYLYTLTVNPKTNTQTNLLMIGLKAFR